MVKANNSLAGTNNVSEFDDYFRNIHEFRSSVEVSLLSVLNYLISRYETNNKPVKIPGTILESEREYLNYLKEKYHKRTFDFELDENTNQNAFDTLTKLIRRSRKCNDYSTLDSTDFSVKYPQYFNDIIIPINVKKAIQKTNHAYRNKGSSVFLDNLVEKEPIQLHETKPISILEKYQSPFLLYTTVLSEIKKQAIDFEFLKMYDYLLETDQKQIYSNKLKEIEPTLQVIGKQEYFKNDYDVNIHPLKKPQQIDVVIDEWASNLRRIVDLQEGLASDLVSYLQKPDNPNHIGQYKSGLFLQLIPLVEFHYRGQVPDNLKITF
jgi:hypothetical protein